MSIAIACAAGAYRGVFVHGVLSAFERGRFRADAYGAASSSVLPAAFAATSQLVQLEGSDYWSTTLSYYQRNRDISRVLLEAIERLSPYLRRGLFAPYAPGFLVATSAVRTAEGAHQTQGDGARRLGRKLLVAARYKDRGWVDQHLAVHLYGTFSSGAVLPLTPGNLNAVIYASTRMLHAWKVPAWIDGRPYVDASYTCSCPAIEMAELGFAQVIAISPEPGPIYQDIFQSEAIPAFWQDVPLYTIQPDVPLTAFGVDYMAGSPEAFDAAFRHGEEKGEEFLDRLADQV